MRTYRLVIGTLLVALVGTGAREARAALTLYATAENGSTGIFGSLNQATGAFTKISNESPFLFALAVGSDGTLYGGGADGNLYTVNPATGATARVGTFSVPTGGATPGLTGLVSRGAAGFYGTYITATNTTVLVSISLTGTSSSPLGSSTSGGVTGSGNLAVGPNGTLYETNLNNGGTTPALLAVNAANGSTTTVGTGYGVSPYLTIANLGGTLYGIDSQNPGTPAIYTINTTTGLATATGLSVTGLPAGYTFDSLTAASYTPAVPEPAALSLVGVCGVALLRRRRAGRGAASRG